MKAFCRKYIIFIYRVNIQTHIKTNHDPEKQSTTPHNPSRKTVATLIHTALWVKHAKHKGFKVA